MNCLYLEGQLSTDCRCITPPSMLILVIDKYLVLLIQFELDIHKFLYNIFSQNLHKHLSLRLGGKNGMEWNEKNIFRIFFPPLVWEF